MSIFDDRAALPYQLQNMDNTSPTSPTPASAPPPGPPPPSRSTFMTPSQIQQTSGWTGVSSAADPYGVSNIGYALPGGLSPQTLLSLNSPQIDQINPPAGSSVYENQNLTAPGTNPNDANWAAQQTAQSYPAYPNSYGLGSSPQPGAQAPPPAPQSYSGGGLTVNVPDQSSRGFNPWSLQGESNARDTQKGVITQSGGGI